MALFKRKEKIKQSEYDSKGLMTSFDQMKYFIIQNRSNEQILLIADTVLSGKPVLANLDKLSASDCNYILSFMAGVVYATEGEAISVGERLYLFARKEEFEDGSLREYVEDIKQWFPF